MDTGIGATLRDARARRKLDLTEVEAAIKIRIRYLRAMENEEWDVLPGGAYTRGFVRTYASYLGLDGERLAEELRRSTGQGPERVPKRVEAVPRSRGPGRSRLGGRAAVALVSLAMLGLLLVIGLSGRGGDGAGEPEPRPEAAPSGRQGEAGAGGAQPTAKPPRVALSLTATGEVWVCLLDAAGEPLLDGVILEADENAGPFRARGYEAAFGNGEFELTVDGERLQTPPSSGPVGYEIDARGGLSPLEEGERPVCE